MATMTALSMPLALTLVRGSSLVPATPDSVEMGPLVLVSFSLFFYSHFCG